MPYRRLQPGQPGIKTMDDRFHFVVNVETDDQTGEIMAVYIWFRKGRVSTTKECVEGAVFADYSRNGKLLGIEILPID